MDYVSILSIENKTNKGKIKNIIYYSILIISIILFGFIIAANYVEADTLWHIKAGEYMVKNKCILTKDIFSWTMAGTEWHSHEWLWEVIAYLIYAKYKFLGICILNIISMGIFLLSLNKLSKISNIGELLYFYFIFTIILTRTHTARPYVMAYMLMTLILKIIITKDQYKISDYIIISMLTIIYANIHSSVIMLPIYIFILSIYNKKYIKMFTIISLSSLITPFHIKTYIYAIKLSSSIDLIRYISEWSVPNFHETQNLCLFIIMIVIYMILNYKMYSKKDRKFIIIINILLLMGIAMYLKSIRHFYSMYILFILSNYIIEKEKKAQPISLTIENITIQILMLLVIIISIFSIYKNPINIKSPLENNNYYPKDAIQYIKRNNINNIWNEYLYGGALIYNDIKVFMDGRADMYYFKSKQYWNEYQCIYNLEKNQAYIKEIIKKYNIKYFMLRKNIPLNVFLQNNYNNPVYEDENNVIYKVK